MTKFNEWLNERKSKYGKGITFVDIDETLFHTFAKIKVVNKKTGEVIKKLSNQEFNSYKLKDDEEFNFSEFEDAKFFKKTSIPIKPTIDRIKTMIKRIKKEHKGSKIIFLTARSDFDDKKEFLKAFKEQGIDVDFKSNVYIERSGNIKTGTVEEKKKQIILKYLKNDSYKRVRMIDDYEGNIKKFMKIIDKLPSEIIEKIKKEYNVPNNEPVMEFYGLLVDSNTGKLTLYDKKEIY